MRIIAGEAGGRTIRVPRGLGTRPALDRLRVSLFSILDDRMEGASVLDLFAGAGGFGLEAVSRGARAVTFVERDAAALAALERNISDLGFGGRANVLVGDALHVPSHSPRGRRPDEGAPAPAFQVVFLDPPFPLFGDPRSRALLVDRLEGIRAGLVARDGVLVCRVPTGERLTESPAPREERVFGASTVFLFEGA